MNPSRCLQVATVIAGCLSVMGCAPDIIAPQSSMFAGESGGCGDFIVYRFNADKTLAITVRVDEKVIRLSDQPASLEITEDGKNVAVEVLQFRAPAIEYFCDDVAGDPPPIATWVAVSGKVVVTSDTASPPNDWPNATHKVSVIFKHIRLRNSKTGEIVELQELEIANVWVGWLA